MKHLNTYHIINDDWIAYQSKICSVACSLEYPERTDLDSRINELVKSYLNQWRFIISAYSKLYNLFSELNSTSDTSDDIITEYDIHSIEKANDFRDYTYLLIISMKTFLDLFACLVDITITQEIKPENIMPSFNTFAKSKKFINQSITKEFNNFRDRLKFPWIDLLNDSRNRIVHRGYLLKPESHFKKGNELTMIIYKGIDVYTDTLRIKVGKLFSDFMNDMPVIDKLISNILISTVEKLEHSLKIQVLYKFGGEITQFSFSEIQEPL